MSHKSFITLEQKKCPVCGEVFDTENILLDTRLKNTLEHKTITGWKLCPQHQKMKEEGFVHFVVIEKPPRGAYKLTIDDIKRNGTVLHIKREALDCFFDEKTCKDMETHIDKVPMMCIDQESAYAIAQRYKEDTGVEAQVITDHHPEA